MINVYGTGFLNLYFAVILISTVLLLASLTEYISWQVNIRMYIGLLFISAASVMLFVVLYDINNSITYGVTPRARLAEFIRDIPLWGHFVIMAVLLALAIMEYVRLRKYRLHNLTPSSIREGLNCLPEGCAFSTGDGVVVHSNDRLEKLCEMLTGDVIMNMDILLSDLNAGRVLPGNEIVSTDPLIVRTADGSSWLFERHELESRIGPLVQITSICVDEELEAMEKLREDKERLEKFNRHLREYNRNVDEIVKSEEQMALRRSIHGNMGKGLIAAKIFLTQNDIGITAEELIEQWKDDITLLKMSEEKDSNEPEEIRGLYEAAKYLGIELVFTGRIPEEFNVMKVLSIAASECMTNAAKFGAARLFVSVTKTYDEYCITISNDGLPLENSLKEGGGLSFVRNAVEKAGGTMAYTGTDRFELKIFLMGGNTER